MKSLLKVIGITAFIGCLLGIGYLTTRPQSRAAVQSFGNFTPVGGQTYTVSGAGVNSNAVTIPLNSFRTPDGRALTMSMFGSIGYAVIDPNSPQKIEDITFTGITQNGNGTAVLTGVSRGMDFVSPYLASTSLAYSHAGGAYLILSNTAGFYGQQFLFANNPASSTATLTFSPTNPPQYYPSVGAQATGGINATSSEFASIAFVQQAVVSGAVNATTLAKGIIQLATAAQAAAGTALGSTGASLVPSNSLFTSTPSATTIIPVTSSSGKLAQGFLDIFTTANTWTAQNIFSGLLATNSTSTNATSTSSQYFPFLTSTLLKTDGTGKLVAAVGSVDYAKEQYTYATTTDISVNGSTYATSTLFGFPSGTLTASSSIQVRAGFDCTSASGAQSCSIYLRTPTGATLSQCGESTAGAQAYMGYAMMTLVTNNSVSSQTELCTITASNNTATFTTTQDTEENTTAVNLSTLTGVYIVIQTTTNNATGFLRNAIVTLTP